MELCHLWTIGLNMALSAFTVRNVITVINCYQCYNCIRYESWMLLIIHSLCNFYRHCWALSVISLSKTLMLRTSSCRAGCCWEIAESSSSALFNSIWWAVLPKLSQSSLASQCWPAPSSCWSSGCPLALCVWMTTECQTSLCHPFLQQSH